MRSSSSRGCEVLQAFLRAIAWLLLAFAPATPAHADHALARARDLDVAGQYWLDASGTAPLEAARAAFDAGLGRPHDPAKVMPLAGGTVVWYRLQMPPVDRPWRGMFEVTFAGMDLVEMFRADDRGGWIVERSGDAVPVNEWPVHYLHPAFALNLLPRETQPTYLRVRHGQDVRVNWMLRDVNHFSDASKLWHLGLGAYLGFMLLVIVLSVVNTISWRDPIHVYYAVHVGLMGLTVIALSGLAGEYLWPDSAWWNDRAPLVLPAVSLAWMNLFVRELVAERGRAGLSLVLWGHAAFCAAMAAVLLAADRASLHPVPSVYTVPSALLILGVLAWYAWRRPPVGMWVLAGWLVLGIGVLLPMLRNLGVLPTSFVTQYALQLAGALEIPLVLVGIYFRSRERRDTLVRLAALARTDPLTGLANHRLLVSRLDELLRRGRRHPMEGSVLRLRVANLEQIRTGHGREAAEAALLQAAECVAREAREGDTVGRERSGDLVLLLEGQATREQVAESARNIIARGLKFSARLPPGVTLLFRVVGACAPLPPLEAPQLLDALDDHLHAMMQDPRARPLRILGGQGANGPASAFQPT